MQQQFKYVCSRNVMRMQGARMQPFSEQVEQSVTNFACCIHVVQTDEAVFEAVQDKFVA